jgi:hypothetical protein
MIEWYKKSEEEKQKGYAQAAIKHNMPSFNVEKDWWVVQTLTIVFNMEIGKHLVFKGGTSLSKSWGIIKRFSEDVDLAVDRKFLGFEGVLGKGRRDKLRKKNGEYVENVFAPSLENEFKERGVNEVEIKVEQAGSSDQDPKVVYIYYPNVVDYPGYIKPRIMLEVSCRSLIEPFTVKPITSFLDQTFPSASFVQESIMIPSVDRERTFLEKIFLLHEEFQKPEPRSERMSRHLYDLYKLMQVPECIEGLRNKDLYNTIVAHRKQFTKIKGVDYDKHLPEFINFIPTNNTVDAYRKDYNEMQENMINEKSPDFEGLIAVLEGLKKEINGIKHV